LPKQPTLDLEHAWRVVRADVEGEVLLPDIIRWRDYHHTRVEWIEELRAELAKGKYTTHVPSVFPIPKDSYVTRPIALLHHRDRLVYEALVNHFAPAPATRCAADRTRLATTSRERLGTLPKV